MPSKKCVSEYLIGLDFLGEIVETAIFSAHLNGSIPISLILIGPSGAGKSKLILQYREVNGAHLTSDITSMGLQEIMSNDPINKVRFLIIPDFNVVLSHRASTLQLTIANLLSVTSEGTVRIDDGRDKKEVKHAPVGIVTAMTRELYIHFARKWAILGFNRRFLPVYYEYGVETRRKIQSSITAGTTTLLQLFNKKLPIPRNKLSVAINQTISKEIERISDDLAENIGWIPTRNKVGATQSTFIGKQLEFSPHLSLRSLAKAHALRNKRQDVNADDVSFLMKALRFTRYDRPGEL